MPARWHLFVLQIQHGTVYGVPKFCFLNASTKLLETLPSLGHSCHRPKRASAGDHKPQPEMRP
eukprot:scaffold72904_cov38-Tisochrysis_lutea.AAC.1